MSHTYSEVRFWSDVDCLDQARECVGRLRFNNTVSRVSWEVNGETRWSGDMSELRALRQAIWAWGETKRSE